MPILIDRPPTAVEVERLRLLLSTYQDGTGMLPTSGNRTLPGWRDFERACALAFGGLAVESKFFVDVIFTLGTTPQTFYGVDCKMRNQLRSFDNKQIIYVEVLNAAAQLWTHLNSLGITESNIRQRAQQAGDALLESIESAKSAAATSYPDGPIDIDNSYYFVLLWNKSGDYQLFQLPLALPKPVDLTWSVSASNSRLIGQSNSSVLYEWYGTSGGQFKYYPNMDAVLWRSERFQLEPLPTEIEEGTIARAKVYFPEQWAAVADTG